MFNDKSKRKMDLDILDELIGKCEDSMVHPFKKKKAVAIAIEPEAEEHEADESEEQSKLDPDDLQELLRMYEEE